MPSARHHRVSTPAIEPAGESRRKPTAAHGVPGRSTGPAEVNPPMEKVGSINVAATASLGTMPSTMSSPLVPSVLWPTSPSVLEPPMRVTVPSSATDE